MARSKKLNPTEISELYDQITRVTQEKNDFLLSQIVDLVQTDRWINIRPEYQRRLVWDRKKKSRFIESLLMNIPVPPVFLFEHELSRYEVMDGQQRINTILEFYNNTLKLTGLTTWSALNGLTRKTCPEKIRRGLDRRRLSATVLLAESAGDAEDGASQLRREVFERLNTGGEKLKPQEMRNSVYAGLFNELLIDLAGVPLFNDIWGIPRYEDYYDRESGEVDDELAKNSYFKRMKDCEIILRFFAFRKKSNIRGSVPSMLDRCMVSYRNVSEEEINVLRIEFLETLKLAHEIFGDRTFQLKNNRNKWIRSESLYDAVMIGLFRLGEYADELVNAKAEIRRALTNLLSDEDNYVLVVGRANTANALKRRLALVHEVFESQVE